MLGAKLDQLRAFGLKDTDFVLEALLKGADFDVQRALNHYYERGPPAAPVSTTAGQQPKQKQTQQKQRQASALVSVPQNKDPPVRSKARAKPSTPLPSSRSSSSTPITPSSNGVKTQRSPVAAPEGWPKLVGQQLIGDAYVIRGGRGLKGQEVIELHCEGEDTRGRKRGKQALASSSGANGKGDSKGKGKSKTLRPSPFGTSGGKKRPRGGSVRFATLDGRIEGRLPDRLSCFLSPLMARGCLRLTAAACESGPGPLQTFEKVYLMIRVEVYPTLFDDISEELEPALRDNAFVLLQFARTGVVEIRASPPSTGTSAPPSPPAAVAAGGTEKSSGKGTAVAHITSSGSNNADKGTSVGESAEEAAAPAEVDEDDVNDIYAAEEKRSVVAVAALPEAVDPPLLRGIVLRRYQRQALRWMLQREKKRLISKGRSGLDLDSLLKKRGGDDWGKEEEEDEEDEDEEVGHEAPPQEEALSSSAGVTTHLRAGCVVVERRTKPSRIHALWERGHMATLHPFGVQDADLQQEQERGGGAEELSGSIEFFVNPFSRSYQLHPPPPAEMCRGGLLCDTMGMGKTIMLLSLLLMDKEHKRANEDAEAAGRAAGGSSSSPQLRKEEGGGDSPPAVPASAYSAPLVEVRGGSLSGGGTDRAHRAGGESSEEVLVIDSDSDFEVEEQSGKKRERGVETGGSAKEETKRAHRHEEERMSSPRLEGQRRGSRKRQRTKTEPERDVQEEEEEEEEEEEDSDDDDCFEESQEESEHDDADEDYSEERVSASKSKKRRRPSCGASAKRNGKGKSKAMQRRALGRGGGGAPSSEQSIRGPRAMPYTDSSRAMKSDAAQGEAIGTLVVCPMSILMQWEEELLSRSKPGALSVLVYYGQDRCRLRSTLLRYDAVLTTYGTLCSELQQLEAAGPGVYFKDGTASLSDMLALADDVERVRRGGAKGFQSTSSSSSSSSRRGGAAKIPKKGLFSMYWRRVILDEAHVIKNQSTGRARAACGLAAKARWCVTGTPIQNSFEDIFTLIRFIRHEPWKDPTWWRKVISEPYERGDKEAVQRLKLVLSAIMLRRTKDTLDEFGKPILTLPPKTMQDVQLDFSPAEKDFYQGLRKRSKIEFEGFRASGNLSSKYVAIFAIVMKLRQACNHPFLALGRGTDNGGKPAIFAGQAQSGGAGDKDQASGKRASAKSGGGSSSSKHGAGGDEVDVRDAEAEVDSGVVPTPLYIQELYQRFETRAGRSQDQPQISALAGGKGGFGDSPRKGGKASPRGSGSNAASSQSYGKAFVDKVAEELQMQGGVESKECPVCLEPPTRRPVLTPCAHLLCYRCLMDCLRKEASCPVCREPMEEHEVIEMERSSGGSSAIEYKEEERGEGGPGRRKGEAGAASAASGKQLPGLKGLKQSWIGSTKMNKLLEILEHMEREDDSAKAVIFSQWTYMLDLVSVALSKENWTYQRLDGSMTQPKRELALKQFAEPKGRTKLLLVSLHAGGVGLNLVSASTVVLMDMWWNPQVESQAIDRVHRLGQTRPVKVFRLMVKGTVEDQMLVLQEKKAGLAKNALEDGRTADNGVKLADLVKFFE